MDKQLYKCSYPLFQRTDHGDAQRPIKTIVCNGKEANKKPGKKPSGAQQGTDFFQKSWYIHTTENYVGSTNDGIEERMMKRKNLPSIC